MLRGPPAAFERALVSVHDKTGIVEFTRTLAQAGVEVVSTGGTARITIVSEMEAACLAVHVLLRVVHFKISADHRRRKSR